MDRSAHSISDPATLHVVGAGLAGLSCALRAADHGWRVALYEAAGHGGGRCRSFHDDNLGRIIDNGSHLLLGANRATFAFLDRLGCRDAARSFGRASFPFFDLTSGQVSALRPDRPWWPWSASRRLPGSRARDYLAALRLRRDGTVAEALCGTRLYESLWRPLTEAALNTAPEEASARLLWRTLADSLLRGEAASRPHLILGGLSQALVDPALAALRAKGAEIRFNFPLRAVEIRDDRATALIFAGEAVRLSPTDRVVLALPPWATASLLPGFQAPPCRAIVNAHFLVPNGTALPGELPFLGITGGVAQWLFLRGTVLAVTVSAADRLATLSADIIADRLWRDCARILGLDPQAIPPHRVIKEKRATLAQTPETAHLRPKARTRWGNLGLAGDWTETGLPCTIEGAIRSGITAAELSIR